MATVMASGFGDSGSHSSETVERLVGNKWHRCSDALVLFCRWGHCIAMGWNSAYLVSPEIHHKRFVCHFHKLFVSRYVSFVSLYFENN